MCQMHALEDLKRRYRFGPKSLDFLCMNESRRFAPLVLANVRATRTCVYISVLRAWEGALTLRGSRAVQNSIAGFRDIVAITVDNFEELVLRSEDFWLLFFCEEKSVSLP
jgi:hypothetical protein